MDCYHDFHGRRQLGHLTRQLGFAMALGLSACAPAKDNKIPSLQAFDSYRQLLRFDLIAAVDKEPTWKSAPSEMRRELALCTAEFAMAEMAPAKISELDAYARDPAKLPVGLRAETQAREGDVLARSTKDDLAPLMPYCKEDATAISKYAK
jgi:hypothetical protein